MRVNILFLLPWLFSCSSAQGQAITTYDTSFTLIYAGNMHRNEGSVPEGYQSLEKYILSSAYAFHLDGTCSRIITYKNEQDETNRLAQTGIYKSTKPFAEGKFEITFEDESRSTLIWAANWHDPHSTPYEAYEEVVITIEPSVTITAVLTYICKHLSEM